MDAAEDHGDVNVTIDRGKIEVETSENGSSENIQHQEVRSVNISITNLNVSICFLYSECSFS